MNTKQYLSHILARLALDSRFHSGKRWSDWPGINFILRRSYKPHNRLQVWEYWFQELRLAITNKELMKIRYSSWKSSGMQVWSLYKRFHEVQESKLKSSGLRIFTTYTLEDKLQELIFWISGIEQNSPHTQEVWAIMSKVYTWTSHPEN